MHLLEVVHSQVTWLATMTDCPWLVNPCNFLTTICHLWGISKQLIVEFLSLDPGVRYSFIKKEQASLQTLRREKNTVQVQKLMGLASQSASVKLPAISI